LSKPRLGDTVRVHYTLTLDDGTVFDATAEREPLEFSVGEGRVLIGFEQVVLMLNPGEWKTVTIPAAEAYGPHREEMVLVAPRSELPEDLNLEPGQSIEMANPDGRRIVARVTEVSDSAVTLDGNHVLAGKDLTFEIQLVEIL